MKRTPYTSLGNNFEALREVVPVKCFRCNAPIVFRKTEDGKHSVPYNHGTDVKHWDVCPFSKSRP